MVQKFKSLPENWCHVNFSEHMTLLLTLSLFHSDFTRPCTSSHLTGRTVSHNHRRIFKSSFFATDLLYLDYIKATVVQTSPHSSAEEQVRRPARTRKHYDNIETHTSCQTAALSQMRKSGFRRQIHDRHDRLFKTWK